MWHMAPQPSRDASVLTVVVWGDWEKGILWLRLLRVDHHRRGVSIALVDMII